MKVLHINHTYQNGGSTGRITYDLKTVMERNGIDSYVAYGYRTGNTDDDHTLCLQGYLRRKWNILRCRVGARHGFYNEHETHQLLRVIDDIQPDLIHLHNIHGHYVHVGMLFDYIKEHHIPVVWTLHDCWSFTGWCAYYDMANCQRWQTHCENCHMQREYPYCWFSTHAYSNFDRKKAAFTGVENLMLVTPSNWLKEQVQLSFLKEQPVTVIHNGIDTQLFRPTPSDIKQRLGVNGKKIILSCVAQMLKRKGADVLNMIPERLHDDEVLIILGVNESEMKTHDPRLLTIPFTNNTQELAELYSAASVFINPTLEDNFPTTHIEALACGTPVVTFHTGGCAESITAETGSVVEKGDLDGLLREARQWMAKPRDVVSNACRSHAEQHFDKNKQLLQYLQLYQLMVQK